MNNIFVEDCVRDRMMSLNFPELSDGSWVEVSHPFIFINKIIIKTTLQTQLI